MERGIMVLVNTIYSLRITRPEKRCTNRRSKSVKYIHKFLYSLSTDINMSVVLCYQTGLFVTSRAQRIARVKVSFLSSLTLT